MAKKSLETLTESMFYVLLALSQGDKCGTEITDFICNLTRQRVKIGPATLYTILGKFEHEHIICEIAVEGSKRTYTLSDKGQHLLQMEIRRLELCLADVKALF